MITFFSLKKSYLQKIAVSERWYFILLVVLTNGIKQNRSEFATVFGNFIQFVQIYFSILTIAVYTTEACTA